MADPENYHVPNLHRCRDDPDQDTNQGPPIPISYERRFSRTLPRGFHMCRMGTTRSIMRRNQRVPLITTSQSESPYSHGL